MLLVLGIADFGKVFYIAITLRNAARAGAAYGFQSNANSGNSAGIAQAAAQEAQNIGAISVTSQQICRCPDGSTVSCTGGGCPGFGAPELYVRVTAAKTFTTLVDYPGIPHAVPLSWTVTLRLQ